MAFNSRQFQLKNRLIAALPPADLERYFSGLRLVELPQKQVLIEQGAPITDLHFLEEGIASVLTTMADGSTIEFSMIGMEGVVGVSALLGGEFSPHQALVQVPGSALRIAA